jgi:hypothetical protein
MAEICFCILTKVAYLLSELWGFGQPVKVGSKTESEPTRLKVSLKAPEGVLCYMLSKSFLPRKLSQQKEKCKFFSKKVAIFKKVY